MKKCLAFLLALMLLFSCALAEDAPDYAGTWYWIGGFSEGMSYVIEPSSCEVVITLHIDGTGLIMSGEDMAPAAWTVDADGNVVVTIEQGNELLMEPQMDGTLLIRDGANHMIMGLTTESNPVVFTYRTGLTKKDFTGQWVMTTAVIEGMTLAAHELGYDLRLSLKNGDGSLSGLIDTARLAVFSTGTVTQEAATETTPARSCLTIRDGGGFTMVFYMCDDGSLVSFDEASGGAMIFEPVVK